MIQFVFDTCVLPFGQMSTTTIYEGYTKSIAQANEVYIKRDSAKHISSKLFYTHDLQNNGEDIQQILSSDNLTDLFMKALLTTTFEKLVKSIGVRRLKNLN